MPRLMLGLMPVIRHRYLLGPGPRHTSWWTAIRRPLSSCRRMANTPTMPLMFTIVALRLKNADPKTFQVLAPPYSKDSTHAYAGAASIEVLDPATFEVVKPGDSEVPFIWSYGPTLELRDQTTMPTSIWGWARDSKAYYYADYRVKDADRDTFAVLNFLYAKDKDRVYYARGRKVVPVPNADPKSFQTSTKSEANAQDRNHKFFQGKVVAPGK